MIYFQPLLYDESARIVRVVWTSRNAGSYFFTRPNTYCLSLPVEIITDNNRLNWHVAASLDHYPLFHLHFPMSPQSGVNVNYNELNSTSLSFQQCRTLHTIVLTRLDYCNAVLAVLPAYQLDRLQSAIYQCSGSHDLPSFSVWSCYVATEGALLVASAWEDRVQALCTRIQMSEQQWTGLPRWQSSTSDGRPVTSTPSVVFVVNADRAGDTTCNTGRPCVSDRRRPGLERPTRLRHVSAYTFASLRTALKTYLFSRTFWHWQHVSHWLCNVVLKRYCACTTLIWSYDDNDYDLPSPIIFQVLHLPAFDHFWSVIFRSCKFSAPAHFDPLPFSPNNE